MVAHLLLLVSALTATYAASVSKGQGAPTGAEVTFTGAGNMVLNGTLLKPDAKADVPAALLHPGSGPTDRDGNQPGLKTDVLKQIAERLAANGFASLRFDKRAVAHYRSIWPKDPDEMNRFFSYDHFVEDATHAYSYLRSQPGIDKSRVAIIGHSEGAMFALHIASNLTGKPDQPWKIVTIGGMGRPMGGVLHAQIAGKLKEQGAGPQISQVYLDYVDKACAALAARKPLPPDIPQGLGTLFNATVLDIVGAYCRIDSAELAHKYPGPVLVINGEDDTQVSPTIDAQLLYKALKSRNTGSVDLDIVPHASHCIKQTTDSTKDVFEGPMIEEPLNRIVSFLKT